MFPTRNATHGAGHRLDPEWSPCPHLKVCPELPPEHGGSGGQGGGFWSKDLWPPNSPNMKPLDYHVSIIIESKTCSTYNPNVNSLKAAVEETWANMFRALKPALNLVCPNFQACLEKVHCCRGQSFREMELLRMYQFCSMKLYVSRTKHEYIGIFLKLKRYIGTHETPCNHALWCVKHQLIAAAHADHRAITELKFFCVWKVNTLESFTPESSTSSLHG